MNVAAIAATFLSGPAWGVVYVGNSLRDYVVAAVVLAVVVAVLKLIEVVVVAHLRSLSKKTQTDIDDTAIAAFDSIQGWFYVVLGLYGGLRYLELPDVAGQVVNILLLIAVVYQSIQTAKVVVTYLIGKAASLSGSDSDAGIIRFLNGLVTIVLWALGILLVLQNVGVNVTSLIAGLGIGGIAIAFALQNILEDLFSSLAIFFDKPFEVGDVIKVGEHTGTVERIGIKTSRLRSPQGEEIVISNKELTSARVQNFRRLKERRVTLTFGVEYETSQDTLERIPDIVNELINAISGIRSHRAHLVSFGDSSLDFQVTYFVETDDYDTYLNKQQEVNFTLNKRLAGEGVAMAYPTQVQYTKNA